LGYKSSAALMEYLLDHADARVRERTLGIVARVHRNEAKASRFDDMFDSRERNKTSASGSGSWTRRSPWTCPATSRPRPG